MPVQCLIRKLTRGQVEKTIADKNMQDRLVLQDYQGTLLLVVAAPIETGDPEAHVVLQAIASADAAFTIKEQEANKEAAKKAAADAKAAAAAPKP